MPERKRLDICRASDTRLIATIAITWLYDRLAERSSGATFDETGWFRCKTFSQKPQRKAKDVLAVKMACKDALEWLKNCITNEHEGLTYLRAAAHKFLALNIEDDCVLDTLTAYFFVAVTTITCSELLIWFN